MTAARVCLAVLVSLVTGLAAAESPSPQEMAVSIANTAEMLAKEGDYDGALRLFQKAYDLVREPVLLYNMAYIHDKRGDLVRAREFYERYLKEEQDAAGRARAAAKLEAVLDRIPGRLSIETEPAGAEVVLDGAKVGRTPVVVESVKRGAHEVTARLPGYQPQSGRVTVVSGETATARLQMRPAPVKLNVACDCKGARVELDGNSLGVGPLDASVEVVPGRHTVLVVPEYGDGVVKTVDVEVGRPARLDVRLRPEDALAKAAEAMAANGDHAGAIRLYQKAFALSPSPELLFAVAVEYERAGDLAQARTYYERYLKEEKDPSGIRRGRAALEDVLDRTPGQLALSVEPAGAKVEVDGREVGKAPLKPVELRRGPHKVRALLTGYEPAEATVNVAAGEETKVSLALKPVPVAAKEPPQQAAGKEPLGPAAAKVPDQPAAAREQPAPAATKEQPAPAAAREQPVPAAAREPAAPAAAKEPAASAATKGQPVPAVAKEHPVPAAAKEQPAPAAAREPAAPAAAKEPVAPAATKGQPVPAVAKEHPVPAAAKEQPAPAAAKEQVAAGGAGGHPAPTEAREHPSTQAVAPPVGPASVPEGQPGQRASREGVVKAAPRPFPWHWVAIGTGGALLAAGGVMTGLAARDRGRITGAPTEDGVSTMTRTEALSIRSSAEAKDKASYALYAVGGAAMATGVVLWVLDATGAWPKGQSTRAGSIPTVAVLPGGGCALGAAGRF